MKLLYPIDKILYLFRFFSSILFVFIVFILMGISQYTHAQQIGERDQDTLLPTASFENMYEAGTFKVKQVIDPYTLSLDNGDIVRLAGLYYMDMNGLEAGGFSTLAHKVLDDLVSGQNIKLYYKNKTPQKNRMGHVLGHVVRADNGAWLQGTIISLGLGVAFPDRDMPNMATEMYALEKEARDLNTGLWGQDLSVLNAAKDKIEYNSFAIVIGKIASTAQRSGRFYLNFGENWRDDFTVSIAQEHLKLFRALNIDPFTLNGTDVRVRGWVRSYNGAFMDINHPAVLEILNDKGAYVPLIMTNERPIVNSIQ